VASAKVSVVVVTCGGLAAYAVTARSSKEGKTVGIREIEAVRLPQAKHDGAFSVEKALAKRRSVRHYADEPLTLTQLSQILWAAQGITSSGIGLRSAPSAGALYPLELYVVAGKVEELPPGIYRYAPQGHALMKQADGDRRHELERAALNQAWIARAPVVLVLSAIYRRTTIKYGNRGIRYADIEAGHASENVYLQSAALGLATCAVGAFTDEAVKRVMGMGDSEAPLYIMPVGKPR